jgi:hypothetical protein
LCEPEPLNKLSKLFSEGLRVEPEEYAIVDFMRQATLALNRIPMKLLVIRGLTPFLTSQYSDPQTAVTLFKESLRKISRDATILVEIDELAWNPTDRSGVKINGAVLSIESLDFEQTLKLQNDYCLGNFIKIRL